MTSLNSLPANFPPNSPYTVSPYDEKLQSELLPVKCEAMERSIRIVNTSNNPVTLKKKTQAFQIRSPHTALPADIKEHTPNVNQDPVPSAAKNPNTYLTLLTYDPDGIIAK